MNTNTRHSSAPPQCQQQRRWARSRLPWIFRQNRRHKRPATPRHLDPAAARPAAKSPLAGGADGPLSFPAPKFSAAVKVTVAQGGSFILASQATGRRWMVISSSRKCQFGQVLRAVELTEDSDATGSSAYFAIKVCVWYKKATVSTAVESVYSCFSKAACERESNAVRSLRAGGHVEIVIVSPPAAALRVHDVKSWTQPGSPSVP